MTWRTDRVCLTAPVSEQLSCAGVAGGEKGFGLHPGNSTFECSQQGKLTGSFFANTGHERMHECTDLKVSRSMFCVDRDIWTVFMTGSLGATSSRVTPRKCGHRPYFFWTGKCFFENGVLPIQ